MDFQNTFFIVRHGKAKNNELGIESCNFQTQKAYGLLPEGIQKVKDEASNHNYFDLIIASPFRRTTETAQIFAKTSNCQIIFDHRLVDVNLGDFDQQPYETSNAFIKQNPGNDFIYPNGESFNQTKQRLIACIKDIDKNHQNKKILIVSHGFPCETLIDWFQDKPLTVWDKCVEKGRVFQLN